MGAFETLIKQETEKTVKDSACVFSAPARVISVESNQRYKVQLITNNVQYTLVNYSGSNLEVGESVQIFYRNNFISEQSAYIGASLTKDNGSDDDYRFIEKTQEQYDDMTSHDAKTIYLIVESTDVYRRYRIVEKTQVEYDSMTTHDADTVYFIIG